MTDETTTAKDGIEHIEDHANTNDDTTAEAADTGRGGNREARYRRALRDTEAQVAQLSERLTALQTAEAERVAAMHLSKPAALWASGVELADLLDGDGNIDVDKVTEAAAQAAETLGASRPTAPRPDPTQGGMGTLPRRDAWSDAFSPRR